MPVTRCHICDTEHHNSHRHRDEDFAAGHDCPICYRPTCRRHLVMVRWRWRNATRDTDSARICQDCKRDYRHRDWDAINREWIT